MVCPSRLGLAHDGYDAREVCLLQDLRVGYFVLPADVGKGSEASEVEVVKLFFGLNTPAQCTREGELK